MIVMFFLRRNGHLLAMVKIQNLVVLYLCHDMLVKVTIVNVWMILTIFSAFRSTSTSETPTMQ